MTTLDKKPARHGMQGGLIAVGLHFGKKIVSNAAKHPFLIFGLGVLAGAYIHKQRRVLIEASNHREEHSEGIDND